eukprot:12250023-Ditylum_brightwellii.AAC.1
MVRKKSSPQRKNQTLVAKGDIRVKVTISSMEEISDTMLMVVINGSTDGGVDHDRRKKTLPDDYVPPFNPNEMLQNKNVQ